MQAIMARLNELLEMLIAKDTDMVKAQADFDARKLEQGKVDEQQAATNADLVERENKVKHIEDIEQSKADAQVLIEGSDKAKATAEASQKGLVANINKFNEEKAAELKKIADEKLMNKKQADALIKERKEFDDKIRAFKALSAVVK